MWNDAAAKRSSDDPTKTSSFSLRSCYFFLFSSFYSKANFVIIYGKIRGLIRLRLNEIPFVGEILASTYSVQNAV